MAASPVPPTRAVALVVTVLVAADVVSAFESSMLLSALPRLIDEFGVTPADASWVITAFALVAAASAAVCGRLGDLYGRRRVLVVLLAASAVGSVLSIVTGTLEGIVVGRAVQGLAGGILPLCFGLIREHLPSRSVPVAVGMLGGAAMIAGASGTMVAGILIDTVGWHYIFVVAAVAAVLAAAGGLLLPRSRRVPSADRRVDWIGAVLFAPAVGLVLLGITSSSRWTWADARTLGCVLGGLLLLAAWIRWELGVERPLIDLRMFADRTQALTLVATALVAAGMFGATGYLVQAVLQGPTTAPVGLGLSATRAGTLTFVLNAASFLLAPVGGWIAARRGARTTLVLGAACGVVSAVGYVFLSDTLAGMIVSQAVLQGGLAFSLAALPILVVQGVAPEVTSAATGVNVVVRTAFSGVGTTLAGLIVSLFLLPGTRFGTEVGFGGGFAFVGVCALGALLCGLAMRRVVAPAPVPASVSAAGAA